MEVAACPPASAGRDFLLVGERREGGGSVAAPEPWSWPAAQGWQTLDLFPKSALVQHPASCSAGLACVWKSLGTG